jgi:hypothetical protein
VDEWPGAPYGDLAVPQPEHPRRGHCDRNHLRTAQLRHGPRVSSASLGMMRPPAKRLRGRSTLVRLVGEEGFEEWVELISGDESV